MRLVLGVAATALVALSGAQQAGAVVWQKASTIPPSMVATVSSNISPVPAIATGADGTTAIAWKVATASGTVARASVRDPGGTFSPPVDLGSFEFALARPRVAVGPDGTVIVVWNTGDATELIVASVRPPGGTFGAATPISPSGVHADDPDITFAPDGSATAAWIRDTGPQTNVEVSTRPEGGTFAAPTEIGAHVGSNYHDTRIVTGADGTTVVAWLRTESSVSRVAASVRRPGQSFGAPAAISGADINASSFDADITVQGKVILAWEQGTSPQQVIQASTQRAGEAFTVPVTVSGASEAREPNVSAAPTGVATITWARVTAPAIVEASTAPEDGGFAAPQTVSGAQSPLYDNDVTTTANGSVTVVWAGLPVDEDASYVQGSTRDLGSPFTAPQLVSDGNYNAYDVAVAAGPEDSVTAVWAVFNGGIARLEVATGIVIPPRVDPVPVPLPSPTPPTPTPPTPGLPGTTTKPSVRGLPRITGTARRGRTLRCLSVAFTGATRISRAWLRNGRAVKGATGGQYKLARKDVGTIFACRMTGANAAGSVAVTSAKVRVRR